MCCGGKKSAPGIQRATGRASRSARAIPQALTQEIIIGSEGMTILEYQLTKAGPQTYRGAVTNKTYVFGGKHKQGLVDNRDVPGFISRIEDRRHAFGYPQDVIHEPPPEPKAEEAKGPLITEQIKEEILPDPTLAQEAAEVAELVRPKRGRKPRATSA
jgi:hypothetical protein